jgi:hypothetical protein
MMAPDSKIEIGVPSEPFGSGYGGDFAVGADAEKILRKLLALPDMDGNDPVR